MSLIVGNIGQFDGTIEQWSSYSERFEYFVLVNYIDEDNIVLKVFSVMGPKTCNLLVSLLHPDRTGNKTYGDNIHSTCCCKDMDCPACGIKGHQTSTCCCKDMDCPACGIKGGLK